MSGFVYFIRCEDRVKIGYSEDPVRRLSKVNADAPFPCELLGWVAADDYPERELHERFAAARLHSEWFAAIPEILAFIEAARVSKAVAGDRFERRDLTDAPALLRWRYGAKLRQTEAAALIGISHAMWNRWELGVLRVAGHHVLAVEGLTGISRHDLRPDIFGPDPRESTPAPHADAAA